MTSTTIPRSTALAPALGQAIEDRSTATLGGERARTGLADGQLPPPGKLRQRVESLRALHSARSRDRADVDRELTAISDYLSVSESVDEALDQLSENLFGQIVHILETQLTLALQEVLEQPLKLRAERTFKSRSAAIEFSIERDGEQEDIMKGQGGSVANVLSVGLRMFALATLSDKVHRRFLVLDEQDCWLRPDLVPRLVKIIQEAGRSLGMQVLMISHHEDSSFERYADRIYRLRPGPDGVRLERFDPPEFDLPERRTQREV